MRSSGRDVCPQSVDDMETHVLDAPHLVLQRMPAEAAQLISKFLLSKRPSR
jgi:hypothetical protein